MPLLNRRVILIDDNNRWDTIMLIQHLREPLQGHHHICAVRFPFQNILFVKRSAISCAVSL